MQVLDFCIKNNNPLPGPGSGLLFFGSFDDFEKGFQTLDLTGFLEIYPSPCLGCFMHLWRRARLLSRRGLALCIS